VTDPTHPLFGRKFEILSVSSGTCGTARVTVRFRDETPLRLLLHFTSLSSLGKNMVYSQLTVDAARELLALVKEYESCPPRPRKSGTTSHRKSAKQSSTNSIASSRR
jgi:hypothetical protein